MTHAIIRHYDSEAQGSKAAEQLRGEGYSHVHLFTGPTGKASASAASRAAVVSDMLAANIWKSHAETYADRLTKGKSMVLVHAPFSTGRHANHILDSHEPSGAGIADTYHGSDFEWDDAAPLSSMLRMPVLLGDKLPAETLTGIGSLTKGKAFLSNLLGIPLLKAGLQHSTSSLGLPLLSRNATPLSSLFGMRSISQSATPLSSMFGLPTLTKRR
jgi:hypothetical protein